MQSKLFRITLNSPHPDLLLRFYSVLGFKFTQRVVDKGSQAWLGQLGDMSIEIFSIQENFTQKAAGVQMSFQVRGMDQLISQFRLIKSEIMMEPLTTKTGVMAIVMDPDGRSIELSESL